MTRYLITLLFISLTAPGINAAEQSHSSLWGKVLTGEHRSVKSQARDVYRHPKQTLAFFAVQPTHKVVEIWPGGGWYTEILAPLLRDQGQLYAAHFDGNSSVGYYQRSFASYQSKMAAHPQVYNRVKLTTLQPDEHVVIAPAASVDRVLTFRNVHNWMKAGTDKAVFAAMYKALKPGGVLGIVEHRAKPGTSFEAMIKSGYVTVKIVKQLAIDAGFKFVAGSEINANSKDSADHPKGVWTLPPVLRLGDKNKSQYQAMGESDRMTLKFVKP
jgi:predicted methyltransferase